MPRMGFAAVAVFSETVELVFRRLEAAGEEDEEVGGVDGFEVGDRVAGGVFSEDFCGLDAVGFFEIVGEGGEGVVGVVFGGAGEEGDF